MGHQYFKLLFDGHTRSIKSEGIPKFNIIH